MKEAREHHYLFAHRVLPHLAWDNPEGFYVTAFTDENSEHLHEWWSTLGTQLEPEQRIAPEGLSWSAFPYEEHLVVSCRFPAPQGMTEAYFAAIVCGPLRGLTKEDLEATPIRYMLLEYGLQEDFTTPRTVLCEWTRDGTHLNRGDGPAPELEIFEAVALREIVGDPTDEPIQDLSDYVNPPTPDADDDIEDDDDKFQR